MAHKCDSTHDAILCALDEGVKAGTVKRFAARRVRRLMRWPLLCEIVCTRVESQLVDDGVIAEDARFDPETWDWDKIITRLKDLTEFVIKLVLMLIDVLA